MRIVVFGATGGTGRELLRQGLAQGHQITAFVRATNKLSAQPNLDIRGGNVYDSADVSRAIAGHDAVLDALGARSLGKSDLLERSMKNILAGMREHAVQKLIVLGASGSPQAMRYQPALERYLLFPLLMNTLLKNPMASQQAQQHLITTSDVDYTVVLPPRLTNGLRTGTYRVQEDALPPHAKSTSRADVADFMLKQLGNKEWIRKMPYMAR